MPDSPKFIQISTLTAYPSSLLNRDDSGLAKRMPFGGAVRTRVSSQCLKRHWRRADDTHALTKAAEGLSLAVRSREIFKRCIGDVLVARGHNPSAVEAVLLAFMSSLFGGKDKGGNEEGEGNKKKKTDPLVRGEVVVLGEAEIAFLLEEAEALCAQAQGDVAKAGASAKEYLKKENLERFKAMGAGVDAAMFGRFISGQPEARVTSAVHVAHALTVHSESSETDYFTAVDDLTSAESAGSGHLGAAELTSGLYYAYVVVDVPQLVANLGQARREDWLSADRTVAARLTEHLIHLVTTVSPGAKLGSTAPYAHSEFVLVEAGNRQPRTLANAFMDPVPLAGPDLIGRAVAALSGYVASHDAMYGPHEKRWFACRLDGHSLAGAERLPLPLLAQAVRQAILDAGTRP